MLVLRRKSGQRVHTLFRQIGDYINSGDLLVVNRSRVVPARLRAKKDSDGGKVEILLLERIDARRWKVLVGGKGLGAGKKVKIENGIGGEILEDLGGAQRLITFDQALDGILNRIGQVPLPPYIRTPLKDPERYQTVYAQESGSAAAPTAGLHFTPQLIHQLKKRGIRFAEIILHIGLDTFAPVTEGDPGEHPIHSEWASLSAEVAKEIEQTRSNGGRVIAIGTSSVRALESAARLARPNQLVSPFEGRTKLFILPGYKFRIVDALFTNFHLPRSTLLMLVSAFAGRDLILDTYREAIAQKYRFYSFGDAMLIL